ncbi:MAG: TetR/AcrR family transcriptional regulator [Hyphomonadaceae bacterium]|nr:TetR/AcrR family transcriptional regulator [Hyphomonadaceae bacterium]
MPAKLSPKTRKPPRPKWRRRAEARPEEILDAALAEFTARGFEAARMEDIAKAAGLSKAAVYLYFPSKMALLEALIQAKVGPIAQRAQMLAQAGRDDPLAALRTLALAAAHTMADARVIAVPRLVIGVSGRFPEIADYYRTQVVEKARLALEALIEAGKAKGAIRDEIDVKAATRAFIGPLLFEALWTHVLRGETALAQPQNLIEQQFNILLRGLERRS